ncbi:hypothetical protein Mp_2g01170 [Marchantia polymorpha subsp. ruderalis]|uniref:Actin-related protein 8 n=1 Tax=Marchantia polymorpha TaxID=3197 RepID=A0A2R6X9F1_MARPO|nr:hypothetical protein MARPO_0028s0034 [Marchantia polymorpha]BBN00684.1 hypothetical protein Mp_2g01170 [Marchantia polymorpha subsp. ruderalis]|eukprot:PTQ42712.1 hypothetical protein MARPO_0028s0034 [Marchantia polymorpha]
MKPLNPDFEALSKDDGLRSRSIEVDDDKFFHWTQVMGEESDDEVDGPLASTKASPATTNVVKDESESSSLASEEKGEGENGQELEEDKSVKAEEDEEEVEDEEEEEDEEEVEDEEEELEEKRDIVEQPVPDENDDSVKESPDDKEIPDDVPAEIAASEKGSQEGSDSGIHVEVRLTADEPMLDSATCENRIASEKKPKYRRFICGEEALRIPATEPYVLRRPICRGRFNICPRYSLQQVLDDMFFIWNWVLTEKLSLDAETRQQFSVVLVIPDTLDNREIKELLTIVLKDLKFRAAVIHQECVTATFGNGISSACVVNMGAQITSIVCIEDGVALPSTRIVLPFGGEDISRCLLWVQRRWQTWPRIDTDPLHDSLDLQMLERIKEERCVIVEGEQQAVVDIYYRQAGHPTRAYKAYLKALCVPVMGLFYPTLLAPEEYPSLRPWFYVDHEDVLDDSFHAETFKRPEAVESAPVVFGNNGGGLAMASKPDFPMEDVDGKAALRTDEPSHGLAQAVVISILSTGRADIQKKLFASIQLVGGVALTRGLVDAVEERVLHGIPAHEAVDTVAVLQNRTDAPLTCWKGGAVLGILDFQREAWVQSDEWITGGVRIGSGRKYRDSVTLQSQAFWYGTNPE